MKWKTPMAVQYKGRQTGRRKNLINTVFVNVIGSGAASARFRRAVGACATSMQTSMPRSASRGEHRHQRVAVVPQRSGVARAQETPRMSRVRTRMHA